MAATINQLASPSYSRLCSVPLVPNVISRKDGGSGKPCALIETSYSIFPPTQDSKTGGRIRNHKQFFFFFFFKRKFLDDIQQIATKMVSTCNLTKQAYLYTLHYTTAHFNKTESTTLLPIHHYKAIIYPPFVLTHPGTDQGLQLVLNVEQYENVAGYGDNNGVMVTV